MHCASQVATFEMGRAAKNKALPRKPAAKAKQPSEHTRSIHKRMCARTQVTQHACTTRTHSRTHSCTYSLRAGKLECENALLICYL